MVQHRIHSLSRPMRFVLLTFILLIIGALFVTAVMAINIVAYGTNNFVMFWILFIIAVVLFSVLASAVISFFLPTAECDGGVDATDENAPQ